MRKRVKKNLTEQERAILRLRKSMPFPTGTKAFKDRKKELNKKWCRNRRNKNND